MAKTLLHPACVAHIYALAEVLGADVEYSTKPREWRQEGADSWAVPAEVAHLCNTDEDFRRYGKLVERRCIRIVIPKLRSDFAYAAALHEIGHAFAGINEIAAWVWAYDNALYWSPMMWKLACRAIASYATTETEKYPHAVCMALLRLMVPFEPRDERSQLGLLF